VATIQILDPVSRIEGHLKVEVSLEPADGAHRVVDARATGTMFRGFELILQNRPATDAPHITQRICGVCPVSHGMASVLAIEAAAGLAVPENARLMRNLVLGANYLQSHILHFYHLAALDYLDGPDRPPWKPTWSADKRITGAAAATLVDHYLLALDMRRKAHEMGALFGGRLPHPPTYIPGGFTTTPRAERITKFRAILDELVSFIEGTLLPDVSALGSVYADYFAVGAGPRNLLSYGVFDLDATGTSKLLRRGRAEDGQGTVALELGAIREEVSHSWFADGAALHPSAGATVPAYPKADAYSWMKSPRYDGKAYEVGPLARMWVNGDYTQGISVMDRHVARAQEALKVGRAMREWVAALVPSAPVYAGPVGAATGQGQGLTEAPRGALGHWLSVSGGTISQYQVVTPTCWNASPRDGAGVLGPIEQALVGTSVANADEPIEVLRVIHSFDPCMSCAVHVLRPRAGRRVTVLGGPAEGSCLV
jgi:hydrogenase large subunit